MDGNEIIITIKNQAKNNTRPNAAIKDIFNEMGASLNMRNNSDK